MLGGEEFDFILSAVSAFAQTNSAERKRRRMADSDAGDTFHLTRNDDLYDDGTLGTSPKMERAKRRNTKINEKNPDRLGGAVRRRSRFTCVRTVTAIKVRTANCKLLET